MQARPRQSLRYKAWNASKNLKRCFLSRGLSEHVYAANKYLTSRTDKAKGSLPQNDNKKHLDCTTKSGCPNGFISVSRHYHRRITIESQVDHIGITSVSHRYRIGITSISHRHHVGAPQANFFLHGTSRETPRTTSRTTSRATSRRTSREIFLIFF